LNSLNQQKSVFAEAPDLAGQSSIRTSFRAASKGEELGASLGMWKSLKDSERKE
jgi:hypothetical protein